MEEGIGIMRSMLTFETWSRSPYMMQKFCLWLEANILYDIILFYKKNEISAVSCDLPERSMGGGGVLITKFVIFKSIK